MARRKEPNPKEVFVIMSKSRRVVGALLASVFLLVSLAGVALANEKVAVINPQQVMFQHPKFEQTQKQIKAVMDKKQNEAKAAIDKEKDNNKKAQIFQAKRQEAAVEEKKLMDPLFKDIDMAIRSVCKAKAVTVVVDKNAVFFGGLDITDDVVQELKKKNAGN